MKIILVLFKGSLHSRKELLEKSKNKTKPPKQQKQKNLTPKTPHQNPP